jgi:hypothetical protein
MEHVTSAHPMSHFSIEKLHRRPPTSLYLQKSLKNLFFYNLVLSFISLSIARGYQLVYLYKDNPLQLIDDNFLDMQIGHISTCHINTIDVQTGCPARCGTGPVKHGPLGMARKPGRALKARGLTSMYEPGTLRA